METSGSEIARVSGRRPLEMVPTEKNIEESYLFAGGANEANETREHVVTATLEDGTQATRRFKYNPSKEYGDTTDVDRDVYRAIMLLAHQNGGMAADGVVHFSLYQLRKILNLPDKGESYRKIKNSIVIGERGHVLAGDTELQERILLDVQPGQFRGQRGPVWAGD